MRLNKPWKVNFRFWLSNSYICMYIDVLANSVTSQLYLRHDFFSVILKVKYKLHIDSGSPATPLKIFFCCAPGCRNLNYIITYYFDKDRIRKESRAMVQANISLPLTAQACIRSWISDSKIWCGRRSTGTGVCPFLRLCRVSLNPALLHNHFQLDITLIRRTSGRSLGNVKKSDALSLIGNQKYYDVMIQGQNFDLLIIRISE